MAEIGIVLRSIEFGPATPDVIIHERLIIGCDRRGERLLDYLTLSCRQIDTEFVGQKDEVAPSMAIALGKPVD